MLNNNPFYDKNTVEYERSLLGNYILGASIGEGITSSVFMPTAHKTIFSIIRELKNNGLDLDIRILVAELEKKGKLDEAGGAAYIAQLTNDSFSAANITFYETEVLEANCKRSIWKTVIEVQDALKNNDIPDKVIDDAVKKLTKITAKKPHKNTGILFSELLKTQFPPDTWFVENLIGSGLTVLAGASKVGKSWAALSLVTALDQGSLYMGKLKTNQCDTLYLALEDTPKRIQRRLLKQGLTVAFNGSRLETIRMTPSALHSFLKANPRFRVVVIDTLQKMLGMNDVNDYTQTVESLSKLKAIADELEIGIVVVHHTRKGGNKDSDHMESALGSTGINATTDCTLTLRRNRGTGEATVSVTGRDVEDASYSLSWNRELCTWNITEQGALKPSLTKEQQRIVNLLESEDRIWTPGEIAEEIGTKSSTISGHLTKLLEAGRIEKPKYGKWCAKVFGDSAPIKETESPNVEENTETPISLLVPNKPTEADLAALFDVAW